MWFWRLQLQMLIYRPSLPVTSQNSNSRRDRRRALVKGSHNAQGSELIQFTSDNPIT
ncbi:hypothetical protein SLEP1_g22257 [Rubroshorea leprosula]|uniref:Ycf15 n=1 Tax=Rubroshorea leprosula TaxID=152421 RepID=A0AAV5JBN5_9ROSI|nr:hypothetical protein SLEP1_g22257 [Rubroshorea leprosula]